MDAPLRITTVLASPNHAPREPGTVIDMLVLHYTGMPTARDALERLCDPAAEVSAHYVVDEDGRVLRLVDEECRAWHAGVSWWRGHTDINNRSIGIEIVNPGHEFGYRPFPEPQMQAVERLCRDILARHPSIPARNVVGHADVAPWRKEDPGELFDWRRLAGAGVGLHPTAEQIAAAATDGDAAALLCAIGYRVEAEAAPLHKAITAFQRHFHQDSVTGEANPETMKRLTALVALL